MGRRKESTRYITSSGNRGCIACWKCVEACPRKVFGKVRFLWHRHVRLANPDACIGCGKCVTVCPRELFTLNSAAR